MRHLAFVFVLLCFAPAAFAQQTQGVEICNDGIDNDGDGFIDCFDKKCAGDVACGGNYIGDDADCQLPQPPGSDFKMKLDKTSPIISTTHGRFVVGDMGDRTNGKDGIPEIVTAHSTQKRIYILDGRTLEVKYQATTPYKIDRYDIAIADVGNTGCAQLFIAEVEEERGKCTGYNWRGQCNQWEIIKKHYVSSWDCEANFVWRTQVHGRPFTLGLADFDQDGRAELYFKNQILDALTGEVIVAGSGDWGKFDGGPVAVDILDESDCAECSGLELVAGGEIYSVNLNAPGVNDGGSITRVRTFNDIMPNNSKWTPKYLDLDGDQFVNSQTSVADFDLDGYLDVLMTGTSNGGRTSVFYWNIRKNEGKVFRPGNNWHYGAGRLNLADLDGDGKMNVAFVSGNYLYALDENLNQKWRVAIDEQSSGYTTTTVFDFNNDGASEIVYRDESNLYIIKDNGTSATFSPGIPCRSLTSNDFPIVVDVDADGATEICVICQQSDTQSIYSGAGNGVIRTYKSGNEPWVSSRKVWNQHGYFNVNVNDDLTIPRVQQQHHVSFSEDACAPESGENRVLNTFLNQSAILNSDGCKTYPSADIAFYPDPDPINVIPPTCPDEEFTVSFTLENAGSLDLTAVVPISFYSGNPMQAGAEYLTTTEIPLEGLGKGQRIRINDIKVKGKGSEFILYAVLNDKGQQEETPIVLPNTGIEECNLGNNMAWATVAPQTFNLSASITNHVECSGSTALPNGSARVFKQEGDDEQTIGYKFYWFDGTDAGPHTSAVAEGSIRSGLEPGVYTVYALHDEFQCSSDTVQVTIARDSRSINAVIHVDHPYTNCEVPDGVLRVVPTVGSVDDYLYEWVEGLEFGHGSIEGNSYILEGRQALTYSVLITEKFSGCQTLESKTIDDETESPVVTVSTDPALCAPANSGAAMASVEGQTAGYNFYWYDGTTRKPTADHVDHTYSGIVAGEYTVVAENGITKCTSTPIVVRVENVDGITATAEITSHETSCATPNGAASAHVGGAVAGYTFRWFDGDNTVTEIGTDPTISGLPAGDYTVEARDVNTGCVDTQLITIEYKIETPTVTPVVMAHQTHCEPANGVISATATGSPGPYRYYWFDGNVGTPDITAANFEGPEYAGVPAGVYTVVAVDENTNCESARATVEVEDQTTAPIVATSKIDMTACDSNLANGQASANVDGVTTNHRFRWFSGADTTSFIAEHPMLSNQMAGTYTVKAIDRVTGCFAIEHVTIEDISERPTLALTKEDNTICAEDLGFTGSVTATFVDNPNGAATDTYVYTWRKNGIIEHTGPEATLNGLDQGMYEVTVENVGLGCVSHPASVQVEDNVEHPKVVTEQTPSTNCDLNIPNGIIWVEEVNDNAPGAPYTFRWYEGLDTNTPVVSTDTFIDEKQGGADKYYTVVVRNETTGCETTEFVQLEDHQELPLLSLTPTPNDICDADLASTPFTGSVSAAITNQVGDIDGYIFTWYESDDASGAPVAGATASLLGAIPSGDYSVTALHVATGCESLVYTTTVDDATERPVITTDQVASTNCDDDVAFVNGQALVTNVDGGAPGAPYSFLWHTGIDTSSPIATATAPTLADVQGGHDKYYTVLVTNHNNGCQNTATVQVEHNEILPIVALGATDNTICAGTWDRTAFITSLTYDELPVEAPYANYTFSWSNGDNTPVINELPAGTYTLQVTNTIVGCTSAPVTVEVEDDHTHPAIYLADTPQTSCDVNQLNGALAASVDEGGVLVTDSYSFYWFDGASTTTPLPSANIGADPFEAIHLEGNTNYTVLVVNDHTQCESTATIFLREFIETPRIELDVTEIVDCNNPGYITASVFEDIDHDGVEDAVADFTNYSFSWHRGSNTTTPALATVDHLLEYLSDGVTPIPADNYTAYVVNTFTHCVSPVMTAQLKNPAPLFDIASKVNVPASECAEEDGIITAFVVVPGDTITDGYSFEWYAGSIANAGQTPPPSFYTDPVVSFVGDPLEVDPKGMHAAYDANEDAPAPQYPSGQYSGATLYGRYSGTYTVVATNQEGCKEYKTVFLPYQQAPVVILAEITPDDCLGDSGAVSVDIDIPANSVSAPENYNLWLISGNNPALDHGNPPTDFVDFLNVDATGTGNVFDKLAAGVYTVVAQEDPTAGLQGCFSAPVLLDLRESLGPIISFVSSEANTNCVAPGDGSLEVRLETDPNDPFHPAFPPPPDPTKMITSALTYEVEVQDSDGKVVDTYTSIHSGDVISLSALANGAYTINARSSLDCKSSESYTVQFEPTVVDLAASVVNKDDALFCNPLLETNAGIEVAELRLSNSGVEVLDDYQFEWYASDDMSALPIYEGRGDESDPTQGGQLFRNGVNGVAAGTVWVGSYWLKVTKVDDTSGSGGIGCESAPIRIDLSDDSEDPNVEMVALPDQSCDNIHFDGRITVTAMNNDMPVGGFEFNWINIDAVPGSAVVTNNISGVSQIVTDDVNDRIGKGNYTIRVRNLDTDCLAESTVAVVNKPFIATLTATKNRDRAVCFTDGQIDVTGITEGNVASGDPGDYIFEWYKGAPSGAPLVDELLSAIDGTSLVGGTDPGQYPDMDKNTYYVLAERTSGPGMGCRTAPVRVELGDVSEKPTITFATTPDQSCFGGDFDGQITVTASNQDMPVGGFDFAWLGVAPGSSLVAGNSSVTEDVGKGSYTIRVTNLDTKCYREGTVAVDNRPLNPTLTAEVLKHHDICDIDGGIHVTEVKVGNDAEDLTEYSYEWRQDAASSAVLMDGGSNVIDHRELIAGTAPGQYPHMGAGLFVVSAQKQAKPGMNCYTAPVTVRVDDKRKYPQVTFATVNNTTCINGFNNTYDAQITVNAVTAAGTPGAGSNYDFLWTSVPDGNPDVVDGLNEASGYTVDAVDGVGTYALTVRNVTTNCETNASVQVHQQTVPLNILNVVKEDQTDCAPVNGRIEIDELNHMSLAGNYVFTWEQNGAPMTPTANEYAEGLVADKYTIVGRKVDGTAAGCSTSPFTVVLRDLTEKPVLELASMSNFACDPGLVNGEMALTIYEKPGVEADPANFGISWFEGKNVTTGPVVGTGPMIIDRTTGDYTVHVVDNVSPNLGCVNTATKPIEFETTTFRVALDAKEQRLCAPGEDGSVEVTTVTEIRGGTSTMHNDFTGFEFKWFHGDGTPHATTPDFTPGIEGIDKLPAGNYYVIVRNALGCESKESAEVVQDETSMPLITLEDFVNPAICILPDRDGRLQVSADRSLNFSDYTFEWFEGTDVSGTPIYADSRPALSGVAYNASMQYTVRVTNKDTYCSSQETYTFEVEEVAIRALASALPVTNCDEDNGGLFATTLEGAGAAYEYAWYEGNSTDGTPWRTGQQIENVSIGTYTVVAINNDHSDCVSHPHTVVVEDRKVFPAVVVDVKNPLTYCDPAKPNGVAMATVQGSVVGYDFAWFEGSVGGTPFYEESQVSGLTAATYVVQATNVLTNCSAEASVTIPNEPVQVPLPVIDVLSHHTNCVDPNGALAANVNGNTSSYVFHWYDGRNAGRTADAIGAFYYELEDGHYTVTATERISGCVSDPVTGEVLPMREAPDFEIATTPTNCEQDVGEAAIEMLNDVDVASVEWDIQGEFLYGGRVTNLPKGEFTVTVVTSTQCADIRTFTILPEVLEFNGISRNNDGKNDYFEIACIQDYPRNNVKIFNRAGTLVYEANGYDNQDVFFDGVSNRGISILGTDLPDGTYFYIIDKGDGSKPKTGYLELLQ